MTRASDWKLTPLCACLFLVGGCASAGLSPLSFGVRHIPGGDRTVVFDAARTALVNLGYQIDRSDPAAGVITTHPVADAARDEPAPPGRRLSSRRRMRRVAQVRLAQSAEAVNLYCKVVVQRQTTEAHRIFAREHMSSDTPAYTPIDREAAATTEQSTVWQTISRDKPAERRILDAIIQQTGSTPG